MECWHINPVERDHNHQDQGARAINLSLKSRKRHIISSCSGPHRDTCPTDRPAVFLFSSSCRPCLGTLSESLFLCRGWFLPLARISNPLRKTLVAKSQKKILGNEKKNWFPALIRAKADKDRLAPIIPPPSTLHPSSFLPDPLRPCPYIPLVLAPPTRLPR